MKPDLLDILRCPDCVTQNTEARLTLAHEQYGDAPQRGRYIVSGDLSCAQCDKCYPVIDGIPRFVNPQADKLADQGTVQDDIATNFGDAWKLYAESNKRRKQNEGQHQYAETVPKTHPYTLDQFTDWINPLTPADFKGKLVLDLGSGLSGFTDFAASFGAQKVIGLEISHAIDSAAELLPYHANLDLVQANLLKPPFAPDVFDLVYTIGVLHHLEEPRAGFDSLARLVKHGGQGFIWVYGREHNELVIYVVDPLRKVLSKLPVFIVRQLIALPMALVLYPLLHTLYHPALGFIGKHLPYYEYFQWLRLYGFYYTKGMITDQLIPIRTNYHTQVELTRWYGENGLTIQSMTNRNHISWRVLGQK